MSALYGAANGKWRGDNIKMHSGHVRAQRLYPDIGPCTKCGAQKAERHHKDGNTANNDWSNIEVLCRKCHMLTDGRRPPSKLDKDNCARGHPYEGANFTISNRGWRVCYICHREEGARTRARAKLKCL